MLHKYIANITQKLKVDTFSFIKKVIKKIVNTIAKVRTYRKPKRFCYQALGFHFLKKSLCNVAVLFQ